LNDSSHQLLLLEDWKPTRLFLQHIESSLLWVGIVTFLLSLAGSLVFSRRVTRSLQTIADTAEEVARGEWDRQAPVQGSVEVRIMADSFNRMTANLKHYYQEVHRQSVQLEDALRRLEGSYADTLDALSRALDARDNETEGHSQRVTTYAMRIAEQMGVDEETLKTLRLGALLHDIGKIGVPDAILRKPGKLTDEEWEIMRLHCEFGLAIVRGIPYLEGAADVIRSHHEKYDGTGYPRRLAGEEIPLVARIFAAADTLDAMTSNRPYRKGRSFSEAVAEIQRCSGAQFDPQVVAALEQMSFAPESERSLLRDLGIKVPAGLGA
jgi:putative nucleotidyltransferase with HDIG domain